jgi:hypothetical protein
MFGKPISTATKADVQRLIDDEEREGRHLEFKSDFPGDPKVAAWSPGQPIPPKRIHPFLEELVAFANADGGVIVLGMQESKDKPPRASQLSPLPQIVELERRVRDTLNDLIEPRLPFVAVKGIVTNGDGSGVLLVETYPSSLGPHWVRPTQGTKVRREDRADPLSMAEIHDMVLRNARRFNEVKEKLSALEREFEQHFFSTLDAMPWSAAKVLGVDSSKGRVLVKLNQIPRSLIGIRVAIVPHQKLGLARLEGISKLVPSGQINGAKNGQVRGTYSLLYQYPRSPRRVLGGVVSSIKNQNQVATLKMDRDGLTELSVIMHEDPNKDIPLSLLLGTAGSALGCYQCLRTFGGSPFLPAEIDVEILSMLNVRPSIDEDLIESGIPLEFRTRFPTSTIADVSDFDEYINQMAGDFANAGGFSAAMLPHYRLAIQVPV